MSQNDMNKTVRLDWEIPNPQYYPDDSAPPIPNSSRATVEENSLVFSGSQDAITYSQDGEEMNSATDRARFTGIPNASKFDYRTGLTEVEIDHIFYSYLNVDVSIPYKFIDDSSRRFDFIFRHFIPALCGLYTIEVPPEGHHLGYWMNVDSPPFSEYSFAINSLGKLMRTRQFWMDGIINQHPESVREYDYIDFIFEFQDTGGYEPFTFTTTNYDITFTFNSSKTSLEVLLRDTTGGSSDSMVVANYSFSSRLSTEEMFIFRLDFSKGSATRMWWDSSGHHIETRPFTNIPTETGFSLRHLEYRPTVPEASCQMIGYNVETSMEELYADVIRPKRHWLRPVDVSIGEEFVLHPYQGNAWEFYNKIFALYPFRRIA